MGQHIHIVAALYHNALFGRRPKAGEEGQRHAYYQRTGAGHNKEGKPAVYPLAPVAVYYGRNYRKRRSKPYHGRGIILCKLGYKVFGAGLFVACAFHKLQYSVYRGSFKIAGHAQLYNAVKVYAAACRLLPHFHLAGHALTGKGGGIQHAPALYHLAVQRYSLAYTHDYYVPLLYIVGVHRFLRSVRAQNACGIRAHGQHRGNAAAGFFHRHIVEQLSHLIKQHNRRALREIAHGKGAHGRHRHKQVFIQRPAAHKVLNGAPKHIVARNKISRNIKQQRIIAQPHGFIQYKPQRKKHARCRQPDYLFCFFLHSKSSLPRLRAFIKAFTFIRMWYPHPPWQYASLPPLSRKRQYRPPAPYAPS